VQDPAPRDICVLFSLTAVVHSGKCMFNSFTIYGVMRTMNVSEGIIASRRGCWRVQVGWHLDFESGLAGIGSAGPTIAPITKLPGTGRGFKVTPRPPGELQEAFGGTAAAGSKPRSTRLAPFTGHPARAARVELAFFNSRLQASFAVLQIHSPWKPLPFFFFLPSLSDPFTTRFWLHLPKKLLLLGVQRRG